MAEPAFYVADFAATISRQRCSDPGHDNFLGPLARRAWHVTLIFFALLLADKSGFSRCLLTTEPRAQGQLPRNSPVHLIDEWTATNCGMLRQVRGAESRKHGPEMPKIRKQVCCKHCGDDAETSRFKPTFEHAQGVPGVSVPRGPAEVGDGHDRTWPERRRSCGGAWDLRFEQDKQEQHENFQASVPSISARNLNLGQSASPSPGSRAAGPRGLWIMNPDVRSDWRWNSFRLNGGVIRPAKPQQLWSCRKTYCISATTTIRVQSRRGYP